MAFSVPYLGHGVGLRTTHFPRVLDGTARADWFEAVSENFMIDGGRPLAVLERARASCPVVLHGVSLSLGSTDPLSERYLRALRALVDRIAPSWVSDHLCWGSVGGRYAHDLLPLPYTEEALEHVVDRVETVQNRLGRQILIENVSSYLTFAHSAMPEWEFPAAIAERADCGILLDVNNVYVSAVNHGFDPERYVMAMPPDRVGQIHLAGHSDKGTHLGGPARGVPVARLDRSAERALPPRAARARRPSGGCCAPKLSERAWSRPRCSRRRMLPLRELQARFLRSIATTPERSDGHGFDPALLELVEGRGRLGSTDRLGVYTEMYWARLLDVLRDDFPRVAAVLGADRFTALAAAYLERHPSTDPSVRWVGANFADFLAEWGPVDDLPFLADLARLEWTRLAVFDAADYESRTERDRAMAAWLKDREQPFAQAAAIAKLFTGELSHRVVNHALQIHGGYGFMEESPISRFYRDQKVLEIGEGTNEVQRLVIARHLGLDG